MRLTRAAVDAWHDFEPRAGATSTPLAGSWRPPASASVARSPDGVRARTVLSPPL